MFLYFKTILQFHINARAKRTEIAEIFNKQNTLTPDTAEI